MADRVEQLAKTTEREWIRRSVTLNPRQAQAFRDNLRQDSLDACKHVHRKRRERAARDAARAAG